MRRIWRIGLIGAVLLIGVGILGLEYLNRVVLPVKLRGWAETFASDTLGRKLTIERVRIHPWHGILLEGVTVEEDARYGKEPFLRIDRISARVLYLPLLKDHRVILPTLRIFRPRVRLLQDSNGLWNVQSLQMVQRPKRIGSSQLKLVIPNIVITEGQLELAFQTPAHRVKLNFQDLNAQLGLALPAAIRWTFSTILSSTPPIRLGCAGDYDLGHPQVRLKVQSSIPLQALAHYLPPEMTPALSLLEGSSAVDLELSGNPKGPFGLKGSLQTEGLHWKASGIEGRGDLHAAVEGQLPKIAELRNEAWPFPSLKSTVDLKQVTLSPIPYLGELKEIEGKLLVDRDGIRTDRLTCSLSTGQPLTMSGSLSSDPKQTFSFQVKTRCPLDRLPPLLPRIEEFTRIAKPGGQASIEMTGQGRLKPSFSFQPAAEAALEDASLEIPGLGRLQEMTGNIHWKPDLLTVTRLRGQFRDRPFSMEGSLLNFSQPEIDARFSWERLTAELQCTLNGQRIEFEMLSGSYGGGTFSIFGDVNGWEDPAANLYGEMVVNVEELPSLFPKPPEWLARLPWKGRLSSRWMLKGPLLKPAEWDLGLKVTSPMLTYQGLAFEQLALNLEHNPGVLSLNSAKADLAGGTVGCFGSWRYRDPESPWSGQLSVKKADLSELAESLQWKIPNISGNLFLDYRGEGRGGLLSALRGTGKIQVSGGQIFELPFFGPFAEMLRIPTLRTLAFQEAEGPFTVGDGKIKSEGLQVKSPQATLAVIGSGGFMTGAESPIEWRIIPTLSPELIPEETRSKIGRAIAKGTSYFIGEVRISGTWKNPKKIFVPKPVTQILNEQIFNLQDLLKGLF